ncbi:hypothetical protein B0H11DRAFT_1981187, partial [Mycena galericulata]
MASFDPQTLSPFRFYPDHNHKTIKQNPANRYLYRVHRKTGPGALLRGHGFVASAHARQPQDAPHNTHFTGSVEELTKSGSAHIAQWKEGTWSSPSHFISASYSLPYVLFETQRRGVPPAAHWYRGTEMQVSVIDALAIPSDVYLGTELVGAYYHDAAFFSRWSQEVLVYGWIPAAAVVATMSVDEFYNCLPKWCGGVRALISPRGHWSTQEVAGFLKILAECNDTPAKEEALVVQSVERSIALLRNAQPRASVHERVDKITRLAAMFCWWPKWIKGTAGTDPAAYTGLLRRVEQRVRERLQL